ncbi:hypothetical protein DVK05_10225 [Halorubrum sp. Atlit-8R]|nr:hypothetical protein DVK08_10290 [Halorubrum sp. Atlit-9R]RLM81357.1 hypothetical protein DVK05_10225 [Halorubrum sp. Atlit-8R]
MELRVDPDESGVCLECGSHLSPRFGRVHGDDDDRAGATPTRNRSAGPIANAPLRRTGRRRTVPGRPSERSATDAPRAR